VIDLISVECLLCIKSHFTINAQNVLNLSKCMHGRVWSCPLAPIQRSWGSFEWSDRHKNCVGEVCLYFQLELNTLEFLSIPTDKNLKEWGEANTGVVPRKLFADVCWYEHFSLFRCGTLSPEVCASILDTPCICVVSSNVLHIIL
jgi:hypothetical protein